MGAPQHLDGPSALGAGGAVPWWSGGLLGLCSGSAVQTCSGTSPSRLRRHLGWFLGHHRVLKGFAARGGKVLRAIIPKALNPHAWQRREEPDTGSAGEAPRRRWRPTIAVTEDVVVIMASRKACMVAGPAMTEPLFSALGCFDRSSIPASCHRGPGRRGSAMAPCHGRVLRDGAPVP